MGPRPVWRGPYVAVKFMEEVASLAQRHPEWWTRGRFQGIKAPEVLNTQSRASTILPDFLRLKLGVYNGKVEFCFLLCL